MSTIELLPDLGQPTAAQAGAWLGAAIAEAEALRKYDDRFFPKSAAPEEIESAHRVHRMWKRWLAQAKMLMGAVRPLLEAGQEVANADEFVHHLVRAKGWLAFTPESQANALEQARRGEVISREQIRREFEARKVGAVRLALSVPEQGW